jgi:subtilisin-like proprotein convertase family protein
MRRISISISRRIGKALTLSFILCLALSVVAAPWHSATSWAFQHQDAATGSADTPEQTDSTFTFTNPASILINDLLPATPYPSMINVSGIPSTIDKVTVTLNAMSHTFPNDIRILLVSPAGQKLVLMGNVGGSPDINNVSLTFDDAATTGLSEPIVSGIYKPTSGNAAPTFPAPAPVGPYGIPQTAGTATLTSVFGGGSPNGTWSLYVLDSVGSDVGQIAGGWTLTITNAITAQNTQAIAIPDSGTASLYPSSFNVSGLIGSVTSTTVILHNFSHTAPDDVDILLAAPGGRNVVLMSDVGGSTPVTNLELTFDDIATNFLPDNGPLVSGIFKPTNIGSGDSFPAPAPSAPPSGNTLSALNGVNPNGTWNLYLVDDNGNNAGSINGGWSIDVSTSASACTLNLTPSLQVFPITGGTGTFDVTTPFGCDWTATSLSSFVTITSGSSGSGGTAPISFSVGPNMLAGRTGIIRVVNGGFTRDFAVQQPSGCPFSLNQETQLFGSGGGAGSVQVTAAGACGWTATTKDNWITINSGAGSGNGTVNFTVAANSTGNERTGTITIGARTLTITQANASSGTAFDFDGDARADLSVFRPGTGVWYVSNSSNGSLSSQQFGLSTDRLVPADYDGDMRTDIAVFRNGTWYVLNSMNGTLRAEQWGQSGDTAVPADYDADGVADLAVWRESNGTWYVRRSSDGVIRAEQFGIAGDKPVTGDYDGDGKADLAVFRPGAGAWHILRSSDGAAQSYLFGLGTDTLTQADYDGDSKTDLCVYRASNSTWYMLQSAAGPASRQFGISTDAPAPADFDGDGKADIAVFRQGFWHILQSTNGTTRSEQWGASGDTAVPSAFNSN